MTRDLATPRRTAAGGAGSVWPWSVGKCHSVPSPFTHPTGSSESASAMLRASPHEVRRECSYQSGIIPETYHLLGSRRN